MTPLFVKPFEGLALTNAEALLALETCVTRLATMVETTPDPKSVKVACHALGALFYFTVGGDLIPDEKPGGLVDDLALLAECLASADPDLSRDLPMDAIQAWRGDHPRLPRWSTVADGLSAAVEHTSPAALVTLAREKTVRVRLSLGGPGALFPHLGVQTGKAPSAYLWILLFALWAGGNKSPRSPGRAAPVKRARRMRDMRSTSDALTAAGVSGGGDESPGAAPAVGPAAKRPTSGLASDLAPAAPVRRPTIHSMWLFAATVGLLAVAAVVLS